MKSRIAWALVMGLAGAAVMSVPPLAVAAEQNDNSATGANPVKPHSHPEEKGMGTTSTAKGRQQPKDNADPPVQEGGKKSRNPYADKRRHYHPRDAK